MNLQTKLILGAVLLAVTPVAVSSLFIGFNVNDIGRDELESQAKKQFIAIREMKKSQIEGYFQTIRSQVLTFSNDRMVIEAMRDFKQGFRSFLHEVELSGTLLTETDQASASTALSAYYTKEFTEEYKNRNAGKDPNAIKYLQQLDQDSLALQNTYIANNPNPLGSKDALVVSPDPSTYSRFHAKYHPHFRDFLTKFGYYDIFLADPETGDLVYTVFEELDFSTSMIDGPYAKSGIGKAFQEANRGNTPETVAITDFAPYGPSYEDQAGFIASPIFDGEEKIGILIFQMPINVINSIMTNDGKWSEVGLGRSGETYLVGEDSTMRNQSRLLIEDQATYLKIIHTMGLPANIIDLLKAKHSSIGLQPVKTKGTHAAMSGTTGFEIFPGYLGVSVLSAYTPLKIPGLKWVMMSEIEEAEAFDAVSTLQDGIIMTSIWVIGGILVIVLPLGIMIGSSGAKKFSHIIDAAQKAAKGDIAQRIPTNTHKGGLDAMGAALNEMFDYFSKVVTEVRQAAEHVATASAEITQGNEDLAQRTSTQAGALEETTASMEEMTSTIKQNADNAQQANQLAMAAREVAEKGGMVTEKAVMAMEEINKSSTKIGDIINVINEIAFQTNLLALNAAVEAARAGEQGRGFAVVASEVRNLAQRSATAAKEIKDLINESVQKVGDGSQWVNQSGQTLAEIVDSVKRVTDIIAEISAASQEQAIGIDQVNKAVMQMDQGTQQNAGLVEQATSSSQSLKQEAGILLKQVAFFNTEEETSSGDLQNDRETDLRTRTSPDE